MTPLHATFVAPSHLKPGGHKMQLVALARYEPAWHVEHVFAFTPVLYSLVPLQSPQPSPSRDFFTNVPGAQFSQKPSEAPPQRLRSPPPAHIAHVLQFR